MKLTHIRLLVPNFSECFRFYRYTLGLEPAWGDEQGAYAEFEAGACRLALFDRQAMAAALGTGQLPVAAESQDPVLLVFEVDELDEVVGSLRDHGVAPVSEPQDRPTWGIRTVHVRDPAGNLIEFYTSL